MEVTIRNKRNILTQAILCDSLWSQARGLMFKRPQSLIFQFRKEKIVRLHMIGVFFPIDIITLSKQKVVLEKASIKPLQFFRSRHKARYVIEMPKDSSDHISIGDRLDWESKT